jgi:hypothetical protein
MMGELMLMLMRAAARSGGGGYGTVYLTNCSAEELSPSSSDHIADEQTAIGATDAPEVRRRRHTALNQVLRHRLEVLVRAVPLLTQGGLVPARAVFAATADVGHHFDAAAREPADADAAAVVGQLRDLR